MNTKDFSAYEWGMLAGFDGTVKAILAHLAERNTSTPEPETLFASLRANSPSGMSDAAVWKDVATALNKPKHTQNPVEALRTACLHAQTLALTPLRKAAALVKEHDTSAYLQGHEDGMFYARNGVESMSAAFNATRHLFDSQTAPSTADHHDFDLRDLMITQLWFQNQRRLLGYRLEAKVEGRAA